MERNYNKDHNKEHNGDYSGNYNEDTYRDPYAENYRTEYGNSGSDISPDDLPLDKRGRSIPNRFGLKLVFSILEVPFSLIPGILALIFTCLQDSSYRKREWTSFRKWKALSTVFLVIGGIISSLMVMLIAVIGIGTYYLASDQSLMQELMDTIETGESTGLVSELTDENRTDTEDPDEDDYDDDYNYSYDYDHAVTDLAGMDCITINGQEMAIPMSAEDFLTMTGEEPAIDSETPDLVESGNDETYDTSDDRFTLDLYNGTDEEQPYAECMVGGLDFYPEEEDCFIYMNSLNEASAPEDYIAVLGDGFETYDLGQITEYCWFTPTGWFSVDFKQDSSLYCISIYSYTEIGE